jgi:cyanophycin synthetase
MRVLNVRILKGISAWSAGAALHAVIGDVPEGTVCPGHVRRLECQLERLCVPPYLARAEAGGRTRRRTLPAAGELVVDLAGELQYLCGEFHGVVEAFCTAAPRVWNAVLECQEFALADACLRTAIDSVSALLGGNEFDLAESYRALLATAEEVCPVSSPGLVVSAARDRGIPVFRLGPDNAFRLSPDEVLQLGEGIHQRWLHPWGTMTDRTGYLAGHLANDKAFVKALWAQYGIPVPEGRTVADEAGAVRAAAALGGPVVVKAVDADCGHGLTLRPSSPDAVSAAFTRAKAASTSGNVIVERFLPGAWHRLLVVDHRLVAALRREPAGVIGDGQHTIRELAARANRDVRRGPDNRWPLRFLCLEETELEFLAVASLTPDSVLHRGKRTALRATAAAAAGAESFDVTDCVHPETRALALDAVKLLGLDIAGLDLIATDISRPLREQQGGFLEINEQPAIFVHAAPLCSPPRPVGEAIVESLFPGGRTGRIPLVVIIGRQLANLAESKKAA